MKNEIITACETNESLCDKQFSAALDACWTSLDEARAVVRQCSLHVEEQKLNDLLLIGVNAISDLTAALMTMRQGFHHSSGVLLRPIVENVACIIAFNRVPEAYTKFKNNELDKPKMISEAKKYFSELGKIYGMLSVAFTHEESTSLARGISEFEGKTGYVCVPPLDKVNPIAYLNGMIVIAFIANFCGEVLEWVFSDQIDAFMFWKKVNDEQIQAVMTPGKEKALGLTKELHKLIEASKAKS